MMKQALAMVIPPLLAAFPIIGSGVEAPLDDLTPSEIEQLDRGEVLVSMEKIPGRKARRCVAMGVVEAPIRDVWMVLSDYNAYSEFMIDTPVAFLVERRYAEKMIRRKIENWKLFERDLQRHKTDRCCDNDIFYFYNRFNMPWPLKDRYFLLRMRRGSEPYVSSWRQVQGNTRVNRGSWSLYPFQGQPRRSLAVYRLITDPGIAVPRPLIRMAVKTRLPGSIRALRERTSKILESAESP